MKPLLVLSFVGFALGLAVHGTTYLDVDAQSRWPAGWLLNLGILVVLLPPMSVSRNSPQDQGNLLYRQPVPRNPCPYAPVWLRIATGLFGFYAIVNLGVYMLDSGGTPIQRNGAYFLHPRRAPERPITPAEYHHFRVLEGRGQSGHWMALYLASAVAIWDLLRRQTPAPAASKSPDATATALQQADVHAPLPPGMGFVPQLSTAQHQKIMRVLSPIVYFPFPIVFIFWLKPKWFPNTTRGTTAVLWLASTIPGVILLYLIRQFFPARCDRCSGWAIQQATASPIAAPTAAIPSCGTCPSSPPALGWSFPPPHTTLVDSPPQPPRRTLFPLAHSTPCTQHPSFGTRVRERENQTKRVFLACL